MAAVAINASALNTVKEFAGGPEEDIELWLAALQRSIDTFRWDDVQVAGVVKQKLTGKAAFWLDTQRRLGRPLVAWNLGDNAGRLKLALETRFTIRITRAEGIEAVAKLQQKRSESVREFYDRVIWAVDVKNHVLTDAQKLEAWYVISRDNDIHTFFAAGLNAKIYEKAMSGGNPPVNAAELLTRADDIERAMEKSGGTGGGVAAVEVEQRASGETNGLEKEIAALKLEMSKVKCYNCQSFGHFSRSCPKPRKQQQRGGGHQGRGHQGRGSGNRGRGSGGRGGGQYNPRPATNHNVPYNPSGYWQTGQSHGPGQWRPGHWRGHAGAQFPRPRPQMQSGNPGNLQSWRNGGPGGGVFAIEPEMYDMQQEFAEEQYQGN